MAGPHLLHLINKEGGIYMSKNEDGDTKKLKDKLGKVADMSFSQLQEAMKGYKPSMPGNPKKLQQEKDQRQMQKLQSDLGGQNPPTNVKNNTISKTVDNMKENLTRSRSNAITSRIQPSTTPARTTNVNNKGHGI